MLLLLQLNVLFVLCFVFWEDQRHLTLPVWVFFLLLLNWVGLCFIQAHWLDWVSHTALNILCVSLCLALLYLYAQWRFGHFINKVFGLGDVFSTSLRCLSTPVFLVGRYPYFSFFGSVVSVVIPYGGFGLVWCC